MLVGSDYKKYSIMFRVQCETTSFNKLRLSKKKKNSIPTKNEENQYVDVLILT